MRQRITALAHTALIREAETTPKPGLVDCRNNGAHRDMDLPLFRKSAEAVAPFFGEMAAFGGNTAEQPFSHILPGIRPIGVRAEEAMFRATGGVNTHKGAIFTLGILSAAAGRLSALALPLSPAAICETAGRISAGVEGELTAGHGGTKGQRAFLAYGVTGIRGEAARGFPHVLHTALPALLENRGVLPENHRMLLALLLLMADVDDTNVLSRAGASGAAYVKASAASFLANHRPGTPGWEPALRQMDDDFILRNLSPGGCADLLAAAWMLDALDTFPVE